MPAQGPTAPRIRRAANKLEEVRSTSTRADIISAAIVNGWSVTSDRLAELRATRGEETVVVSFTTTGNISSAMVNPRPAGPNTGDGTAWDYLRGGRKSVLAYLAR